MYKYKYVGQEDFAGFGGWFHCIKASVKSCQGGLIECKYSVHVDKNQLPDGKKT